MLGGFSKNIEANTQRYNERCKNQLRRKKSDLTSLGFSQGHCIPFFPVYLHFFNPVFSLIWKQDVPCVIYFLRDLRFQFEKLTKLHLDGNLDLKFRWEKTCAVFKRRI